jgi:hypothetical protein
MAGPDDRRRLALDEESERLRVTREDGVDRPAGIEVRGRSIGRCGNVGTNRRDSG